MTIRTTRRVLAEIIATYKNAERLRQKLYNAYRKADAAKHAIVKTHSRERLSVLNSEFAHYKNNVIKALEEEIYKEEERKLKNLIKEYEDLHEAKLADLRLRLRRY